jgi:hypothetical protein
MGSARVLPADKTLDRDDEQKTGDAQPSHKDPELVTID